MRLRKLEIAGFKSFMNRLEMEFSSGITAIVGPNGCGKTNIVDAIRWVLGEQKTRLLRNTKMENVLFNGTQLRKPLGMAEVHLTLTNEDRTLPLDYNEVTISRRLYRSGLSEYSVNSELSRLKAIKGLLFDTGLGNHAYSIIEREMVDTVLSDKEQDKKHLLEEAAGIMRYRVQREEALRKIKLTELDITRLNDILGELDKEIRSLRYQRAKAKRFMKLKEKTNGMETALLKMSLYELLLECDKIRKDQAHHEEITLVDDSEISLRESRLQQKRIENTELERKLQEIHEKRYNLSRKLQQNDEKIAVYAERISSSKERIAESEEEIQKSRRRLQQLESELSELKAIAAKREKAVSSLREAIPQREGNLQSISQNLEKLREVLKEEKQLALDLAGEKGLRAHLEQSLSELEGKRRDLIEHGVRLRIDEQELQEENSRRKKDMAHRKSKLQEVSDSLQISAKRKSKIGELIGSCDSQLQDLKVERGRLQEKKELLQTIKREHSRKSVKEVLAGNGVIGVLADLVSVKKEYRKCFEACLTPLLQSLVAESEEDAIASLHELHGNGNGSLEIIYPAPTHAPVKITGEEVVGYAAELIECEPEVRRQLASCLDGVVVVEDVEAAITLLKNSRAERVATLDGVFFDGPGKIILAPSGDLGMTLLEYRAKIEELEQAERIASASEERNKKRRQHLQTLRERLLREEAEASEHLGIMGQEVDDLSRENREVEIKLIRIKEKIASVSSSVTEIEGAINSIGQQMNRIGSQSRKTALRRAGSTFAVDGDEQEAAGLEHERDELRESIAKLKLEEATLNGELQTIESKIKYAEKLSQELEELIESRQDDIERAKTQISASDAEIKTLSKGTSGLHKEKDHAETEIETLNTSYEALKQACEELEGELKVIKERRDEKQKNLQQCTVALASQEARIGALLEKAREKFDEDLSSCVENRDLFDSSEWEDMDRNEFEQLKEQLEGFGPVNMLALEEYQEKKGRFDFLVEQKQDLEEARDSLLQAIRRINREARRLLSDTFEKVRSNFKATFLSLFDGGEADLLFVDSDDPLEANIRIVANPKGKKLHDISSLSGGERALVALSLLFAIYLVKPSPFCIFDEVDAPLDDANITRFVRMLRSFTDRTQFIVITHNKRTMEAADFLYGVTMEEPGVSKMISVEIGDVEKLRRRKTDSQKAAPVKEQIPVQA